MFSTTIISTEELAAQLGNPNWIVIDCRFTLTDTEAGRRFYEKSHIPGARYAHLDEDLSSPITSNSGRHPLPDLALFCARLGEWGITPDTQVVVYDDSFGSMAVRLWWLLRGLGHQHVALLNGGLPKWTREKRPLTDALPTIVVQPYPCPASPNLGVDAATVETIRLDPNYKLIDARPEQRFSGEVEKLDTVAGHIPGAINWVFEENLDMDGTYLTADELRESYDQLLNGVAAENVVHTCGSGVTACHNLLAMEIAGLAGSKLYPGSWSEWIRDPARPVATFNAA
ncbi:MAG: sulfurtransferase [Hydrogenophilales bacterium 28-61-11]|nr:MAG: sulfurtransferase [Hydrogenophilales bacterium 28-61-11]OYZ56314.1 MAG: sulfurtransferase [Hydrogenophilales bacterium 16-61-112]OZA48249.1 MAG: sulfurtransferase [Hydrogenophilales bacterium 17-61-76]HQT29853.1 sulfurtransferase [Thiobacillus sp.]